MNYHGIANVLAKLDITIVEELNGWVRTACPFAPFRHERGTDNKPGFGVSIHDDDISYYNCLACKSKGALSTLPMQLAHYRDDPSLIEFGKQLANDELIGGGSFEFGEWEAQTPAETEAYKVTHFPGELDFYRSYQSALAYPEACRYLARRKISANTVVALGLRYDPEQFRLLFPIYDQRTRRFAGCSGRSIKNKRWMAREEARRQQTNPRYNYPKIRDYGGLQKDRVLLGYTEPRIPNRRGLLVCEGLFAYARLRQLRPRISSCAILGSAVTEAKAQLLIEADQPIYWFTDDDIAGKACLYGTYDKETQEYAHDKSGALYRLYGEVAQFTVTYPEGKTDPDELTGEEVDLMIENATLFIK